MKLLKGLALACVGFIALAFVVLMLLARFGTETQKYRCTGSMESSGQEAIVFLKFELYRPIIFWGNSAGQAWSEVPNTSSEYYSSVVKNGDILTLGRSDRPLMGTFSTLSNAVMLEMGKDMYKGSCRSISR